MVTHRMRGLLISVLLVTAGAEMRRMFLWLWVAVASLGIAPGLMAIEPPEPLDCAAPNGVDAAQANEWVEVTRGQTGPRVSPSLVWSGELKRFLLVSGMISHQVKGPFPYDVMSYNAETNQWENDLPKKGETWGSKVGTVEPAGFKSPYFAMVDEEGIVRPWRRQAKMWYLGTVAPWDGSLYTLMCGRTLRYNPAERLWKNLAPENSPAPETRNYKKGLNWAAMCADPINEELLLFGGCGLATTRADAGTAVYSTRQNEWRSLGLEVQPPPRALAPMVYDPTTKKIVLFGGDGLDRLYADTWVYDCASRTWEQRKPKRSPSPRFGHALLHLPQSGKIVLLGGIGYTSSTSYQAKLYRPHPFEIWTYDVLADEWSLIRHYEEGGPAHYATDAAVAAVDDRDRVMWWGPAPGSKRNLRAPATWLCAVDSSTPDQTGTVKHGVEAGTSTSRTGSYDPAWYSEDVPAAQPDKQRKFYASLPANRWVSVEAPKWPENRQGGGWSTTAYDTDRQQILHLGGGHSSYFGNDVAHFNTGTARWSISDRPQFALDFNYDLSGPGPWAFNGGPWGNHNYHAYTYDPARHRLIFIRNEYTHVYDPVTRTWPINERLSANPFYGSKYTSNIIATPQGVVVWALRRRGSKTSGVWKLGPSGWNELDISGDALPLPITDGATIAFDAKRNRLLITTTRGEKEIEHSGQVWACDLETGVVKMLSPEGRAQIKVKRFAREAVILPELDLVMLGYHLDKSNRIPFYDIANNRWCSAEIPGSEFFVRTAPGTSVDLGLTYDAERGLVWGVMCKLRGNGAVQVLRLNKELKLDPLE